MSNMFMLSVTIMKFLLIFGPPAVGKMTVGHEVEQLTGFKLFHNHMTVDLAKEYIKVEDPSFGKLVEDLRMVMLRALAASDLKGVIFTAGLDFNEPGEIDFVNSIESIFTDVGADAYYLELEAPLGTRLERNKTPFRLAHKPTKRNLTESDQILIKYDKSSRFNTHPGEFNKPRYLKVDNTYLDPAAVAKMAKEKFGF